MRGSSWMINCTLFMHCRARTVTETVETTRKREKERKKEKVVYYRLVTKQLKILFCCAIARFLPCLPLLSPLLFSSLPLPLSSNASSGVWLLSITRFGAGLQRLIFFFHGQERDKVMWLWSLALVGFLSSLFCFVNFQRFLFTKVSWEKEARDRRESESEREREEKMMMKFFSFFFFLKVLTSFFRF